MADALVRFEGRSNRYPNLFGEEGRHGIAEESVGDEVRLVDVEPIRERLDPA